MRQTLAALLGLFRELQQARDALQGEFAPCLSAYYKLSRGRRLTVRPALRPRDRTVRGIYLAMRLKGSVTRGARRLRLHRRIKGTVNEGLIYKIARDFVHVDEWFSLDRVRLGLNARAAELNFALRDLSFSLAKKFVPRATDGDRKRCLELLRDDLSVPRDETDAVLGAIVHDRLLEELEGAIGALVTEWKKGLPDLPFEPILRWRETGMLRLTWAFPERFHDANGDFQVRSTDIPGGVTDRWLRAHHALVGGAERRKTILRYVKALRPLLRTYSKLVAYAGALKRKVHRALHANETIAAQGVDRDVG